MASLDGQSGRQYSSGGVTAEKVYELDKWAVKLKIDLYKWLYIGRTRLGDETGYQIETIFYGRDRRAPNTDKELKYPIEAGFNKTFDIESDD